MFAHPMSRTLSATAGFSTAAMMTAALAVLPAAAETTTQDAPAPLDISAVTASSSDGNLPENTVDGDLTTRWSALTADPDDPEWIAWDLGEVQTVGYLGIAWHQGEVRTSYFDLDVSADGEEWTTVVEDGESQGGTIDLEPVTLGTSPDAGQDIRFIRYTGYGNSAGSGWNSISAIRVYPPNPAGAVVERLADQLPEPDPDAEPWTEPGLVDPGGDPVTVAPPAPVTGATHDVTDFGADPAAATGDDAAAIRAAIAAAEPGDEIYFPAGVYDLDTTEPVDPTTNLALRSGVHLRGAGQEKTVLRSALTPETSSGKVVRGFGVSDVAITGLTLSSTFDGDLTDDPAEAGGGGPAWGIFIANSGLRPSLRVLVEDVTVERFQRAGVRIEKSQEVVVRDSTFRDATSVGGGGQGYGVMIQGTPLVDRYAYTDDSRYNVVENSTFEGPYLRHGILLQYWTHNNLIAGNTLTETVYDAIDLHGEDEYLNEVRQNTVIGSKAAGIGLGNTGGTATQHDASGPGNWIHRNVLKGNREGVIVHLGSPETLIENNVITDGDAAPARSGVEIRNAPDTVVRGNTISGNRANGFWGIHLRDDPGDNGHASGVPTDVLVEGNVVAGNANGIRIDAGVGIVLDGNRVKGNAGEQIRISDDAEVTIR